MTLHLWYQHKSFCCRKEMAVAWDAQLKSNGDGGGGERDGLKIIFFGISDLGLV